MSHAVKDKAAIVADAALKNPNIQTHHVISALSHPESGVALAAMASEKMNHDVADHIVKHGNHISKMLLTQWPDVKKEHLDALAKDAHPDVVSAVDRRRKKFTS